MSGSPTSERGELQHTMFILQVPRERIRVAPSSYASSSHFATSERGSPRSDQSTMATSESRPQRAPGDRQRVERTDIRSAGIVDDGQASAQASRYAARINAGELEPDPKE